MAANKTLVTQLYSTLNTCAQEAFGAQALTVKNGSDFVGLGNFVMNSTTNKDAFIGSLTNVIGKTVIVNRAYTTKEYPFLVDAMEYGSIYRKIKVFDPTLQADPEWDPTLDSDQFAYMPVNANEYLFQKLGAWTKMLSIPDAQLKTAFESETAMSAFFASIYDQIETAVQVGIESLCRMALATYIAEKIYLELSDPNKIHAVNVLQLYNNAMNKTLTTPQMYTDKEFMRFFARLIGLYKTRMQKLSVAFNSTDIARHTPEEYLDFYCHSEIATGFATYLYGDTFHDEYVKLPTFHEIPYWQAPGLSYAIDDTTRVKINLASDDSVLVEKDNILAVLVDREAICTYFQLDEVETTRHATKKYTNQVRSATRGMLMDLGENGIVFYGSWTPPVEG